MALGLKAPLARASDPVAVPVPLQVELLVKVAAYDKNFSSRAGDRARILILTKKDDAESTRVGRQAERAAEGKTIGSLDVEASMLEFSDGAAVARAVQKRRAAIVYAAPGFTNDELSGIAQALEGMDVLSVGAVAKFVPRGIVLSFDLVSGKPKLVVHLSRARKQNVELSSRVLKLMKVFP